MKRAGVTGRGRRAAWSARIEGFAACCALAMPALVSMLGGCGAAPNELSEPFSLGPIVDLCRRNPACYWQRADHILAPNGNIVVEATEMAGLPTNRWLYLNGGIETFAGQRYATLRVDRRGAARLNKRCPDERTIAMSPLEPNGRILGAPQMLHLPEVTGCASSEDARLIACGDGLYAVYNSEIARSKRKNMVPTVRVFLAEMDVCDPNALSTKLVRRLESPYPIGKQEKNWTPFCYSDQLHFVLQSRPHTIAALPANELYRAQHERCDEDMAICSLQLEGLARPAIDANIEWRGGPWSGGTQAVYDEDIDAYVTFFHSYLRHKDHRFYYASMYTFAPKPPFAIESYIAEPIAFPPLSNRWHPYSRVVFPMGLIDEGNQYLVSYGQDDSTLGLARIQKSAVYSQLRPAH